MKPQGVMGWFGIGYNAKTPLIFVKAGVKINTDVYREEILDQLKFGLRNITALMKKVSFQYQVKGKFHLQNSGITRHFNATEPHRIRARTLNQTSLRFRRKDEWTAASPDLNPLDYSIWSIIQNATNAKALT
jgi:hypothetical protein